VVEVVSYSLMWLFRPFTAPAESLLHRRVGERTPGFASVVALGLMELFSVMAQDAALMHLLMFALVARVAAVIVLSVLARRRGPPWCSRSTGTPWLCTFFPGLPDAGAQWAEPFALLAAGMAVKTINTAAGDYLALSALALLATTVLRHVVTYSRYLDVIDEQIAVRPVPALASGGDASQAELPWPPGFPVELAPTGA